MAIKRLDIDWSLEREVIREACFAVLKAHDLYQEMNEDDKLRFDSLVEQMTIEDEVKDGAETANKVS